MKRFVTYTAILLGAVLVCSYVVDVLYTYVYNNGAYRSKVMWIRDMKDTRHVDYLVLGSSRTNYSIKPNLIYEVTGKNGYNLGMNSCSVVEMKLVLEEFLKRGTTKTVFVQVDDQYKQDYPDPIGEVVWMPFIKEDAVYKNFHAFEGSYTKYKYIPFYRYQKLGARLGVREVISSASGSGYNYELSKGYMPRYGMLEEEKPFIPDLAITTKNKLYESFVTFCEKNDIAVYFFTAPYYKFEGDLENLNTFLPNYINFSDSLTNRTFFSDQIHLNTKGAKRFTEIFIETYFSKTPDVSEINY